MIITRRNIIKGLPFEEYLKLPGLSYSGIKNGGVPIVRTAKMHFGSLVDAYLFEPAAYSGELRHLVRPVAKEAKTYLGAAIRYGCPQLVATCRMEHMGMYIDYKGRLDIGLKPLVIDMKVSELDQVHSVNIFGYDNQLNGYALAYGATMSILFSIHPKTLKVSTLPIPVSAKWWEDQVLIYGKPVKQAA